MAVQVWEDEILRVLPNRGEPRYAPVRAEGFHTRITGEHHGDRSRETGEEGMVRRRVPPAGIASGTAPGTAPGIAAAERAGA